MDTDEPNRRYLMWWAALAAALAAGLLYQLTLAPSITVAFGTEDSGELASTAYTLGIAHPTGYPLYTLLGYAIAHLGSDPAHSLNAFSGLMGALAIGLLAGLAVQCARAALPRAPVALAPAAAALAAIPFAVSTGFWTEAVATETRTLAIALDGAVLLLLLGAEPLSRSRALTAALLYGLALCDHLLSLYLAPACMLLLLPWARARLPRWLALLGCFLLGLSPYLYLPIRAAQKPVANWGDPDTPSRFLWVVTGKEFRYEMFSLDLPGYVQRVNALWSQMQDQLGGVTVFAAAVGLVVLARRTPLVATALALTFVVDLVGTSNYQADAAPAYLLLASYCLCIVAGVGWLAIGYLLAQALRRVAPPSPSLWVATLLCLVAGVAAAYPAASTANEAVGQLSTTALRAYGADVLRNLPPHAILFADDIIFPSLLIGNLPMAASPPQVVESSVPFWYAQRALGVRPDVTIVAVGLLNFSWYYRQLRALPAFDARLLPASSASFDGGVDLALTGQRVQWLIGAARPGHPIFTIVPETSTMLGGLCARQPRYGSIYFVYGCQRT